MQAKKLVSYKSILELGATEDCIRVLNGEQPNNDALKDTFGRLRRL